MAFTAATTGRLITLRTRCVGAIPADIFVAVGDILLGVLACFVGVRRIFVGVGIIGIRTTVVLAVGRIVLALALFLSSLFAAGFASRWIFHTDTINTTTLCWARYCKTRIICTFAFFAGATAWTLNASARIADTLAFAVAHFAGITRNAFAGVIDALAGASAALCRGASFGIADVDALAFFAELVGGTGDTFAGIADALAVLAKLSVGATETVTVVFDALAVFASLACGAGYTKASIHTDAFLAFFVSRANDIVAAVANVVATFLTARAFTIAAVAATRALDAVFA